MKTVGSRAEVFHGNAKRTSGRLTKDDLMKNAAGRIVSRKKHEAGKNALKFLHAKGYIAVKGKFGSKRASDAVTAAEAVVVVPAAYTASELVDERMEYKRRLAAMDEQIAADAAAAKASEVVVPPATS